jgi:hypothetical protein
MWKVIAMIAHTITIVLPASQRSLRYWPVIDNRPSIGVFDVSG